MDKELLLHKFSTNDIPKFKATDNPYFKLRAFETIMGIKGVHMKVFPSLFSLSLEPVCQQWYFSVDSEILILGMVSHMPLLIDTSVTLKLKQTIESSKSWGKETMKASPNFILGGRKFLPR